MIELTGFKLPSKQIGWLLNRGYFVETNARGLPRITYGQVEDMRRNNTPMRLPSLKNIQITDRNINFRQLDQMTSTNSQQQSITSEPNMSNLLLKINQAGKNG